VLDCVKMILLTNDSEKAVNIQRRQQKRYGAMFTCLNNWHHHYQLTIYCDNAQIFRSAETELQRSLLELNGVRLNCEYAEANFKWKFNAPGAPHFGDVGERPIRTI
jgi:hypothetical protein